jgi:hypothetical protein
MYQGGNFVNTTIDITPTQNFTASKFYLELFCVYFLLSYCH